MHFRGIPWTTSPQRGREGQGGQKCRNLLIKKATKGEGGGHRIGKMGRHRLWMAPYLVSIFYNIFLTVAMAVVENDWNRAPPPFPCTRIGLWLVGLASGHSSIIGFVFSITTIVELEVGETVLPDSGIISWSAIGVLLLGRKLVNTGSLWSSSYSW